MLYGLDIGGTKIELAAFDQGKIILSKRVATPTSCYQAFKNTIKHLVEEADRELNSRGTIGIGIPGVLNPTTLKAQCTNIPCINNQDLLSDLEFILDRPVRIENDANCFVVSEATGGAGDGYNTVLGIILGTGCGGAIYLDGKLYKGNNNMAGEWGHTPLPHTIFDIAGKDFPILDCGCGQKGCLDSYLSGLGLQLIHQHFSGDSATTGDIIQLYRDNNNQAHKTMDVYCELLACSLAGIINTIDPDIIVIGGGGISNVDELYEILPERLKKYSLASAKIPTISKAFFGDSSGVRGAALLNA